MSTPESSGPHPVDLAKVAADFAAQGPPDPDPRAAGRIRVTRAGCTCRVVFDRYRDGDRLAISLVDAATGEPVNRVTVNMPEIPLGPDEVLVRNYSDGEGMLDDCVAAGLLADTGRRVTAGFAADGVAVARLLVTPPERSQP
jgi:hypothetical protein